MRCLLSLSQVFPRPSTSVDVAECLWSIAFFSLSQEVVRVLHADTTELTCEVKLGQLIIVNPGCLGVEYGQVRKNFSGERNR